MDSSLLTQVFSHDRSAEAAQKIAADIADNFRFQTVASMRAELSPEPSKKQIMGLHRPENAPSRDEVLAVITKLIFDIQISNLPISDEIKMDDAVTERRIRSLSDAAKESITIAFVERLINWDPEVIEDAELRSGILTSPVIRDLAELVDPEISLETKDHFVKEQRMKKEGWLGLEAAAPFFQILSPVIVKPQDDYNFLDLILENYTPRMMRFVECDLLQDGEYDFSACFKDDNVPERLRLEPTREELFALLGRIRTAPKAYIDRRIHSTDSLFNVQQDSFSFVLADLLIRTNIESTFNKATLNNMATALKPYILVLEASRGIRGRDSFFQRLKFLDIDKRESDASSAEDDLYSEFTQNNFDLSAAWGDDDSGDIDLSAANDGNICD